MDGKKDRMITEIKESEKEGQSKKRIRMHLVYSQITHNANSMEEVRYCG